MGRTFLYNVGSKFGMHSDPPVEAKPKHPIHSLLKCVEYLGGDVYTTKYGSSPLTKAQILEDQFAVEGTWNNPPAEILDAIYANNVTVGATYASMSDTEELIRGGASGGEEATRFYAPDSTGFDEIASSPDISVWVRHHESGFNPTTYSKGGVASFRLVSATPFEQNDFQAGTPVEEYEVDTGVPLGDEGTYSLRFEGSIGDESQQVIVTWSLKAVFLAKHKVWIKPFSVSAVSTVSSNLNVIQDSLYFSMVSGEFGETILTIEAEELEQFYDENPTETTLARPAGTIYSTTPPASVTYDDPTPGVTLEDFVPMATFLPVEEV
jgi:hypothetical protein